MNLDKLNRITPVEAPDGLYAKILNKIELKKVNEMSKKTALGIATTFAILLFFNAFMILKYKTSKSKNDLALFSDITTTINLYSNE